MSSRALRAVIVANIAVLALVGLAYLGLVLANSSEAELSVEAKDWLRPPTPPSAGEMEGARAHFALFYPDADFDSVWAAFRDDPEHAKAPVRAPPVPTPVHCWEKYWSCSADERLKAASEVEAAKTRIEGYRTLLRAAGIAQIEMMGNPAPFALNMSVRNLHKLFLMDLRLRADAEPDAVAAQAAQAVGFWQRVAQGRGFLLSSLIATSLAGDSATFLRDFLVHRLRSSVDAPSKVLERVDLAALRIVDPLASAIQAAEGAARFEMTVLQSELERFKASATLPGPFGLSLAIALLGSRAVDVNDTLNRFREAAGRVLATRCYPFEDAAASACVLEGARVFHVLDWIRNPVGQYILLVISPEALADREGLVRAFNRVQFAARRFGHIDSTIESLEAVRAMSRDEALAKLAGASAE